MSSPEVSRAKSICFQCPVRAICLEEALSAEEDWGIWGGYTKPERARALELLGYIDVAGEGEVVPADVETVMAAYYAGELDEVVSL